MVARFTLDPSINPVTMHKEYTMMEFKVEDMTCGHCASVITKTVKEVDNQATVNVDLGSKTVKIESSEERAVLVQALEEAGYPTS